MKQPTLFDDKTWPPKEYGHPHLSESQKYELDQEMAARQLFREKGHYSHPCPHYYQSGLGKKCLQENILQTMKWFFSQVETIPKPNDRNTSPVEITSFHGEKKRKPTKANDTVEKHGKGFDFLPNWVSHAHHEFIPLGGLKISDRNAHYEWHITVKQAYEELLPELESIKKGVSLQLIQENLRQKPNYYSPIARRYGVDEKWTAKVA